MARWKLAPSVRSLFTQMNRKYPNRSKRSDGTIGDASHAARTSDHNPDKYGYVMAGDVTRDDRYFDSWRLADAWTQDLRPKYIIHRGLIWSRLRRRWRPYTGSNKHLTHIHVSVRGGFWRSVTTPWPGLGVVPVITTKYRYVIVGGDPKVVRKWLRYAWTLQQRTAQKTNKYGRRIAVAHCSPVRGRMLEGYARRLGLPSVRIEGTDAPASAVIRRLARLR